MDTRTGNIIPMDQVDKFPPDEKKFYIEVKRKLNRNQIRIKLNNICVCGSGKKFKNCCYNKGDNYGT